MITNSITDLVQANEIIDSILNNTNELLPLDQFTHNCIINDRIDYLRHVASANHTYDEYVASYVTEHGELTNDHLNYGITEYPEIFQMIYPFSKNHFFKTFYPNVLPSVMNSYYSYMKKNNRVMQIGSGAGKCLLIKPVYFSEDDLFKIREGMASVHSGRPRKDGRVTPRKDIPNEKELRSLIGKDIMLYTQNKDGEFIPVWAEETW
jgi:hypothetical protein